jgi:glycogen debranching enzyme
MAEKLHKGGPAAAGGTTHRHTVSPARRLPVTGKRHGLQIAVGPRESREYVLTNKEKAYFAGETGTANTRSYAGLIVELHKFLEGWDLLLGGVPLSAWGLRNACVLPQSMTREYLVERTAETVFLADGVNVLILSYSSGYRGRAAFIPRMDIRSIWEEGKPEYETRWDQARRVLAVRRRDHRERSAQQDYPVWLAIACDRQAEFVPDPGYRHATYTTDAARRTMGDACPFVPGRIEFAFEGEEQFAANVTFAAAVGDTLDEATRLALRAIDEEFALYDVKMRRVTGLLDRADLAMRDSDYRHALLWATASVDSLIMNQMGRGIFAGFHWFPNYWGRDTFICLPGACLVRGEFETAREILETFAGLQEQDERSHFYGRVPNLAMPGQVYYNTADGTLWFLREAYEYLRYTGDHAFAARFLPAARRAVEGTVAKRTDDRGLVVHGEAETWMDAGGEEHPHSPRGNRAVEIQALWHAALESAAGIAEAAGDRALAEQWERRAAAVREVFAAAYWDEGRGALHDHLNPDGTPDAKARPNQILAATVPWSPLLDPEREGRMIEFVERTCVLPHGVASLAPDDPQFHPRHLDLDRYHFDEAYHNGDVWVWLTGPVVSALVKRGRVAEAWRQTAVLSEMFYAEGAAGTLPELRNGAAPERGENVEGAVSQAWSLAEFLRNFYQDYLGVRPNLLAGVLDLSPALPPGLTWVHARVRLGQGSVVLFYEVAEDGSRAEYSLAGDPALPGLTVRFAARVPPGGESAPGVARAEAVLKPGATLSFVVERDGGGWRARVARPGREGRST